MPLVLKEIYYSISATSQMSPDADMPAFFVPHLSAIQVLPVLFYFESGKKIVYGTESNYAYKGTSLIGNCPRP